MPRLNLFRLLINNDLKKLQAQLNLSNVNLLNNNGCSLLHIAVDNLNQEAVQLLLKNNANPDIVDMQGNTPLIYAACRFNYPLTKAILEAGANPNIKGDQGMTAIRWAITNPSGDENLVNLLLQFGANPEINNDHNSNALDYAEKVYPDFAVKLKHFVKSSLDLS